MHDLFYAHSMGNPFTESTTYRGYFVHPNGEEYSMLFKDVAGMNGARLEADIESSSHNTVCFRLENADSPDISRRQTSHSEAVVAIEHLLSALRRRIPGEDQATPTVGDAAVISSAERWLEKNK